MSRVITTQKSSVVLPRKSTVKTASAKSVAGASSKKLIPKKKPTLSKSDNKIINNASGDHIVETPSVTVPIMTESFEVFGRVQRVFFRKYTKQRAEELNIHGFVQNTDHATVTGVIQGSRRQMDKMKSWLRHEGSPASAVSHAVFATPKPDEIGRQKVFTSFDIVK